MTTVITERPPDADRPLAAALNSGGAVAGRMPDFEERPEQIAMARNVEAAFEQNSHLVAEAGTGVGKSFAYLIPSIARAVATGEKIIVSTNTIALQEQLYHKDIPFLKTALPTEFMAQLMKGRSNYICLRRLERALRKKRTLFEDAEAGELQRIASWAEETTDGTRSDIDPEPDWRVWNEISSDKDACLGRSCPCKRDCFYNAARDRARRADILIVNHHLFFADMALRVAGSGLLPPFSRVVLDEAHTVESVATEHMGIRITEYMIAYFLDRLYNPAKGRGFLAGYADSTALELLADIRQRTAVFFDELSDVFENRLPSNGRIREGDALPNPVGPMLSALSNELAGLAGRMESQEDEMELANFAARAAGLACELDAFTAHKIGNAVYWLEPEGKRRKLTMKCSPIDVSDVLRKTLFAETPSVILTSATLTVPGAGDFAYLKRRLGIDRTLELAVGSPFDYKNSVVMYLSRRLPDPSDKENFFDALVRTIPEYIRKTDGKAFVLFTSYGLMRRVYVAVRPALEAAGIKALMQGEGMSRNRMLDFFRANRDSVIFGTSSFWQGVDVPGDALSNVIIPKLPFDVPDHPLIEARTEEIRKNGGSPFFEYSVPEAAIRFKQGFGRLIRRKTDKGIFVVLDSRILTRGYGRVFLKSIPECKVVIADRDE